MPTNASDLELVGVVAGIVATARKHMPKLDGRLVLVVAAVAAFAVCYVAAPGPWQDVAARAVRVAIGAVGGVSLFGYAAGKVGEGMGRASMLPPAPAEEVARPESTTVKP